MVDNRILPEVHMDEQGCWIWPGYKRNGYASMSRSGRPIYLHRIVFQAFWGPIPPSVLVCHHCDVRNCLNPGHMFRGSKADNNADAWRKGRASPPPRITGERHAKATLSSRQVDAIQRDQRTPQRVLGAKYGVSQSTIWRIRNSKTRTEG